jgi:hypothetical protein
LPIEIELATLRLCRPGGLRQLCPQLQSLCRRYPSTAAKTRALCLPLRLSGFKQ